MKKMTLRNKNRANQEVVSEKEVSDLTVRKLTLKTGVKAGYVGSCTQTSTSTGGTHTAL